MLAYTQKCLPKQRAAYGKRPHRQGEEEPYFSPAFASSSQRKIPRVHTRNGCRHNIILELNGTHIMLMVASLKAFTFCSLCIFFAATVVLQTKQCHLIADWSESGWQPWPSLVSLCDDQPAASFHGKGPTSIDTTTNGPIGCIYWGKITDAQSDANLAIIAVCSGNWDAPKNAGSGHATSTVVSH